MPSLTIVQHRRCKGAPAGTALLHRRRCWQNGSGPSFLSIRPFGAPSAQISTTLCRSAGLIDRPGTRGGTATPSATANQSVSACGAGRLCAQRFEISPFASNQSTTPASQLTSRHSARINAGAIPSRGSPSMHSRLMSAGPGERLDDRILSNCSPKSRLVRQGRLLERPLPNFRVGQRTMQCLLARRLCQRRIRDSG